MHLKMCWFVKCLFSIQVSLNCVRGGCSQTPDIIEKKCFMISRIESQPICLLILICSKMVSGGEAQESIYASTSLAQVWDIPARRHSICTLFISLTLVWAFIMSVFYWEAWTYLLLSVWISKQRGSTMAHNGYIPQEIIMVAIMNHHYPKYKSNMRLMSY